jgi:hypothetical protein
VERENGSETGIHEGGHSRAIREMLLVSRTRAPTAYDAERRQTRPRWATGGKRTVGV